jgi:hypothetical protein
MGDDPKQDGDVDPVVFEDEDDDAQEHATREPLRFSAPI